MKISSSSFSYKHKMNALKRICKALIIRELKYSDLNKVYIALLHLERYLERLHSS